MALGVPGSLLVESAGALGDGGASFGLFVLVGVGLEGELLGVLVEFDVVEGDVALILGFLLVCLLVELHALLSVINFLLFLALLGKNLGLEGAAVSASTALLLRQLLVLLLVLLAPLN